MTRWMLLCAPLLIAAALPPAIDLRQLVRLEQNSGLTLQWISWDYRGKAIVTRKDGVVRLTGGQNERGGAGRLVLDGEIVAMTATGFTFKGRIRITDTPDAGRDCVRDGIYEFRITGKRRYWRLQRMEACDGLTDYVDIYF